MYKPQTIESIEHIRNRKLPFIIAINKIDKPGADINKVKRQLANFNISEHNNVIIEVSALTGENINVLLSSLILLSQKQELKSDPSQRAEGIILEAKLDKQSGIVSQLLLQNGTLKRGDFLVAGGSYGKVKAITNSLNKQVVQIESTSLATVLCFNSVPQVGLYFQVVKNEKEAKYIVSKFSESTTSTNNLNTRISLHDKINHDSRHLLKQVNIILKTSEQGAIEAIIHALAHISQEKVQLNLLLVAIGEVSLRDIKLAQTSNSIILAFNLKVSSNILHKAKNASVMIKDFRIIYDLIDYVKNYMLNFVEVDYAKQILGHASVRNIFTINRGTVAGCLVTDGKLKKKIYISIRRQGKVIFTSQLDSLKILKEDVEEVVVGNECGVMCNDYHKWCIDDEIEAYDLKPLRKIL